MEDVVFTDSNGITYRYNIEVIGNRYYPVRIWDDARNYDYVCISRKGKLVARSYKRRASALRLIRLLKVILEA